MRKLYILICIFFAIGASGAETEDLVVISPREGVEDYSRIIQKVFDLKPGTVLFKTGTYSFKDIRITDNVNIIAEDNVIFNPVPVSGSYQKTGLHMCHSVFVSNGVDSITIKGVHFSGKTGKVILDDSFKSSSVHSYPLIYLNGSSYLSIDGCIFENIEGCTYCDPNFTHYGNKKGILICLYDVNEVWIQNNEISGCRHDEQIWSIAVNKQKPSMSVHFVNNYIHDESPDVNSSILSCVAGKVFVEKNRIERFNYKGSAFNLFGDVVYANDNIVKNSYATSIFDTSEYGYFFSDSVFVRNNVVSAKNSQLLAAMANYIECKDNYFEGQSLLVSENQPAASKSRYHYFYQIEEPREANASVVVEGNFCNFTLCDQNLSSLSPEKYGYGIYIFPYYNIGRKVLIKNNEIHSFNVGDNLEKFSIQACNPVKIVNMNDISIEGNSFYGSWYHPSSRVYTTPIIIEMDDRRLPGVLDASSDFSFISRVNISRNSFDPGSPNCTIVSINRRNVESVLRIRSFDVKNNKGEINAPMLYNSFAENISLSGKMRNRTNPQSQIREVNGLHDGERLENGTILRLHNGTVWRSTNVVFSFCSNDTSYRYVKPDEIFYQGVYWIRLN